MDSNQKFIFGIIITIAITISVMVTSCNLKQKSDYQSCLEAIDEQSSLCHSVQSNYDTDNLAKSKNMHNLECMSKSQILFDKCEPLNKK